MLRLRDEMRRLGEEAGDEDELWRMRVADVSRYWWTGETGREQASADMALCLAAAAYFEARGDWTGFHCALDVYAVRAYAIGAWEKGEAAARRRLKAPAGSEIEGGARGEALTSLAMAQVACGANTEALTGVRAAVSGTAARRAYLDLFFRHHTRCRRRASLRRLE
jgi:hypothetical protein